MAIDAKYGKVKLQHTPESMTDSEPVIVFRAQDALVLPLLARYRNLAAQIEDPDKQPSEEFFAKLAEVEETFRIWQAENADRVKIPD